MSDNVNLVLESEAHPEKRVTVSRSHFVIGAGAECDLVIHDASISTPHACIVKRENEYTIWDLSSRNGTYIVRPGSAKAEPAVAAVPKVATFGELECADWGHSIRLTSGMRIAFASDRWIIRTEPSRAGTGNVERADRNEPSTSDSSGVDVKKDTYNIELEVLNGNEAGRLIPVADFPAVLGRSSSQASIAFNSTSQISRAHAVIMLDERKRVCIEDCESRNGTYLNSKPVKERTVLRNGDTISLGREVSLRVHLGTRSTMVKKWVVLGGLLVAALALAVPLFMIGMPRLHDWCKKPAPVPEAPRLDKTLSDWKNYLKEYEVVLPDIVKTLSTVSETCVREHWEPLTNSVATLALIQTEKVEVISSSFETWLQDVAVAFSAYEEEKLQFTSYGHQRLKMLVNREETRLRNAMVGHIEYGQHRDAQDNLAKASDLGFRDEFWILVPQVIKRLEAMSNPSMDIDAWLQHRQLLTEQEMPNDLREAVSKQIGVLENETIDRMRLNAEQNQAPDSRMEVLRQAQRIRDQHPGLSADIAALRPLLEPLIRDRLIKASDLPVDQAQELYRELIKLTQKGDWTEPYYERCRALL